jgi:hypothetical protein
MVVTAAREPLDQALGSTSIFAGMADEELCQATYRPVLMAILAAAQS